MICEVSWETTSLVPYTSLPVDLCLLSSEAYPAFKSHLVSSLQEDRTQSCFLSAPLERMFFFLVQNPQRGFSVFLSWLEISLWVHLIVLWVGLSSQPYRYVLSSSLFHLTSCIFTDDILGFYAENMIIIRFFYLCGIPPGLILSGGHGLPLLSCLQPCRMHLNFLPLIVTNCQLSSLVPNLLW